MIAFRDPLRRVPFLRSRQLIDGSRALVDADSLDGALASN